MVMNPPREEGDSIVLNIDKLPDIINPDCFLSSRSLRKRGFN